jgi:hypothetical protein
MWQIVWMLNLLPDWVFHMLLIAGIVGIIASYILKRIPFVNTYNTSLRILSILIIIGTVWVEGGRDVQHAWEEKLKEAEEKVAVAEAKSKEENVRIETKVVKKLELVRERGADIIQYVDREVVKDKEVIKFVEQCPIPEIILKTHNAAALNQPVEEKK